MNIKKSATSKHGEVVTLCFKLTQHYRDEKLMKNLENSFGCGNISKRGNALYFRVTKIADITKKIIPFFQNYSIIGVKALNFADWCKVAELM